MRERSEGVEGRCVAFTAASGKRREAGGGGARARAGQPRALSSWREVGGDWQRPVRWASTERQVSPGEVPLSLSFLLCFLFSVIC